MPLPAVAQSVGVTLCTSSGQTLFLPSDAILVRADAGAVLLHRDAEPWRAVHLPELA